MTKSELVANEIYNQLFNNYLVQRKGELESLSPEDVDNMYGGIFGFYQSRNAEEKDGLISFIKIIVADTASVILGGLDGATDLGTLEQGFVVSYLNEEIHGNLQNHFLSKLEE